MDLYVLFGLRRERYEGENAPEALEVMDEVSREENPGWLDQKLKERRLEDPAGEEWAALKIVKLTGLDMDALRKHLLPPLPEMVVAVEEPEVQP